MGERLEEDGVVHCVFRGESLGDEVKEKLQCMLYGVCLDGTCAVYRKQRLRYMIELF